jgi:hypothetical protein
MQGKTEKQPYCAYWIQGGGGMQLRCGKVVCLWNVRTGGKECLYNNDDGGDDD